MKTLKKNVFASASALILIGLTLSVTVACNKAEKTGKTDVKTIYVGTGTNYRPYCYLDEKGNLVGYEIDVLNAIDDLLPQYEFKYETFDFKNILLSLSAGKIDIGAHQYESNPERRKNYLFTEKGYNSYDKYIEVLSTRDDISSLDSLAGKTATASTGSATAALLQKYNDEVSDDKKIKLILTSEETLEQYVASIKNGTYDAGFYTKANVDFHNKEYGNIFKAVGDPISYSQAYFIFNLQNESLKKDVDEALQKLIDSGKLAELAIKNLGADYLPKN